MGAIENAGVKNAIPGNIAGVKNARVLSYTRVSLGVRLAL